MGNLSSSRNIVKSKTRDNQDKICATESMAAKIVWGNDDLIHEIMDLLSTFKEITTIPQICRSSSNSLFSYQFKDRKDQLCDWIVFYRMNEIYCKDDVKTVQSCWKRAGVERRAGSFDKLMKLRFYSLIVNLDYMDNIEILKGCKRLTLREFGLEQLRRISQSGIFISAIELELEIGRTVDVLMKDNSWVSNMLSGVKKVTLSKRPLVSMFPNVNALLWRLPMLYSLTIECHMPTTLFSLLPNFLIELTLTLYLPSALGRPIDLTPLQFLKRLVLSDRSLTRQRILIPEGLDALDIPCIMWHEIQTIPHSLRLLQSGCFCISHHDAVIFTMRNVIEHSCIQDLDLVSYPPFWWEHFLIPSSIRSIRCTHTELGIIMQQMNAFPDTKLTHLFIGIGYTPYQTVHYQMIACGKDKDAVPVELTTSEYNLSWYHFPLGMIGKGFTLPIPLSFVQEYVRL